MGRVVEPDPRVQTQVADRGQPVRPEDVVGQVDEDERRGHGEGVAAVEEGDGFGVDGAARQGQGQRTGRELRRGWDAVSLVAEPGDGRGRAGSERVLQGDGAGRRVWTSSTLGVVFFRVRVSEMGDAAGDVDEVDDVAAEDHFVDALTELQRELGEERRRWLRMGGRR